MALFNAANPTPTKPEQEFLKLMTELVEKGLNLEEAAETVLSQNKMLEESILEMLNN